MTRVPYLDHETASAGGRRMFEVSETAFGRIANHSRLMAYVPHIDAWHTPLVLAVKSAGAGHLSVELKTAIIIRVSVINSCEYCVHHNSQFADTVDMPKELVELLMTDPSTWPEDSTLMDDSMRAALIWAERVATNTARRDSAAFEDAAQFFEPGALVEITYIAAHRTMQNLFQEALWVDLEEPGTPNHTHMAPGYLSEYARDVLPDVIASSAERP